MMKYVPLKFWDRFIDFIKKDCLRNTNGGEKEGKCADFWHRNDSSKKMSHAQKRKHWRLLKKERPATSSGWLTFAVFWTNTKRFFCSACSTIWMVIDDLSKLFLPKYRKSLWIYFCISCMIWYYSYWDPLKLEGPFIRQEWVHLHWV